jgi:hypothetical protein
MRPCQHTIAHTEIQILEYRNPDTKGIANTQLMIICNQDDEKVGEVFMKLWWLTRSSRGK